ncbi:hypothetical protein D3C85_1553020 [compost metagenome]
MFMRKLLMSTGYKSPMCGLGEVFRAFDQFIDISNPKVHSFQLPIQRIEQITEKLIGSWLDNIPQEWFIRCKEQRDLYKNFLLVNQHLTKELLSMLVQSGAFHSWTGHKLTWL